MKTAGQRFGTVVLTGATSGIGEATARRLAAISETLIVLGPEPEEGARRVLTQIRGAGPAEVHYVGADFTHLSDVVEAARSIRSLVSTIDLLINNAGVPGAAQRVVTMDGFERTLQVNALAPALLTRLLVPSLADGARIVNVGSSAHRLERFHFDDIDLEHGYSPVAAYARAKLAMVTWSSLLAEELRSMPVSVVALCPGLNDTPLSAAMTGRIGGPPARGAARVLHAAVADVRSGSYLEDDHVVSPSADATDPSNRKQLTALYWDRLLRFAAAGRER
ncbi:MULTISPECIES: SDR family NAD(P)-dependent oxidoreductase [unclassified Micromonospora]|uniref:SDR family NAD(P)-dependent oxidoreductase n=1 Tax=unclassified Micromonospora TaxID=2617518 RepID=UPI002417113A|nr:MULTISPECIES: SDR family NAD(P)-dependent oxidoreductase [unclassified Micromonospora]MDG4820119.1 SDR family NAD(P)-dependent oxidoreductase [Micromonospora sp. WMMD956]WFE56531.1 SDR family NAD(P)-dependent oxidoreductase [Micromonospora sp. WMMD712]